MGPLSTKQLPVELLTISGYFVQFKPSSYGEDSPDIPRKLQFPGRIWPAKAPPCVCVQLVVKTTTGKSRELPFFCWWPNLLLRSLPSSPVFGSFPGKEGDQQRVCVAASCLSVCVRANELEEPPLEELQHLKSESKRRLAAQESGRFARNIRKIVCGEESTPQVELRSTKEDKHCACVSACV